MLPNADQAFIDPTKLTDYLANLTHREGGPKARFLASLGFNLTDLAALAAALLAHGRSNPAAAVSSGPFGVKYHVDGPLWSPMGVSANIRTVWNIDPGQTAPRLVTLKPLKKGAG